MVYTMIYMMVYLAMYHGIYTGIYHPSFNGIYYDIYHGINHGIYHDLTDAYHLMLPWLHWTACSHLLRPTTCHSYCNLSPGTLQLQKGADELIFFSQQISTFHHWISSFRHPPLYFRHNSLFFRLCVMFAQGRQSEVSSVDAVTLRHAQPKLKHLAMHWANQTAMDGVGQVHDMPPMERTQLSREQS